MLPLVVGLILFMPLSFCVLLFYFSVDGLWSLTKLLTYFVYSEYRSSADDYCPQDQVEMIQHSMLDVLENIYKDVDVQKLYNVQWQWHQ